MMRYVSIAATCFVLMGCACTTYQDRNWDKNCQRNYSTNEHEYDECRSRVEEEGRSVGDAMTVSLDPENAEREGLGNVGKK